MDLVLRIVLGVSVVALEGYFCFVLFWPAFSSAGPRHAEATRLVDGEIAAIRAEYVGGEIDVARFEELIERALRGDAERAVPVGERLEDGIRRELDQMRSAGRREPGIPSQRLPVRREPLPDWAKEAIRQELDSMT